MGYQTILYSLQHEEIQKSIGSVELFHESRGYMENLKALQEVCAQRQALPAQLQLFGEIE